MENKKPTKLKSQAQVALEQEKPTPHTKENYFLSETYKNISAALLESDRKLSEANQEWQKMGVNTARTLSQLRKAKGLELKDLVRLSGIPEDSLEMMEQSTCAYSNGQVLKYVRAILLVGN